MEKEPGRKIHWDSKIRPLEQEFKEKDFEIIKKQAEEETGTEIKDFLKKIDFNLLNKLFSEEYSKSGLSPELMNFVGAEHIYSQVKGSGAYAEYQHEPNLIAINLKIFDYLIKEKEFSEDLARLQILIHELTHAVAKLDCYVSFESRNPTDAGYKKMVPRTVFTGFNEGVTDKIASELVQKYVQQSDFANTTEGIFFTEKYEMEGPYSLEVHQVNVFINLLAKSSGLSKETVWGAVKAGALNGDNLYTGELREFLNQEVGSEFMNRVQEYLQISIDRSKDYPRLEKIARDSKAMILKLVRKLKQNS
jgi:hypothetical protein